MRVRGAGFIFVLLSALGATLTPAAAQRSLDVSVAAGPAFSRTTDDVGAYAQLSVGRAIPRSVLYVRGEASFASAVGAERSDVFALGGAAQIAPRVTRHPWRPYLIAGAGAYRHSGGPDAGFHFGANGGAGVWLAAGGVELVIETRYHVVNGIAGSRYLPVVIGLRF